MSPILFYICIPIAVALEIVLFIKVMKFQDRYQIHVNLGEPGGTKFYKTLMRNTHDLKMKKDIKQFFILGKLVFLFMIFPIIATFALMIIFKK